MSSGTTKEIQIEDKRVRMTEEECSKFAKQKWIKRLKDYTRLDGTTFSVCGVPCRYLVDGWVIDNIAYLTTNGDVTTDRPKYYVVNTTNYVDRISFDLEKSTWNNSIKNKMYLSIWKEKPKGETNE